MAELKTKATTQSVLAFIHSLDNARRRQDALALLDMFSQITGEQPILWGDSIIGYGTYTYDLANGKQGTFMRSGFSPRKQNLSIYVGAGMSKYPDLLTNLGKHKTSKACLYINKLADVDMVMLAKIVQSDLEVMNQTYPK
jgi:hypothetical protein